MTEQTQLKKAFEYWKARAMTLGERNKELELALAELTKQPLILKKEWRVE
mgnify:CR=1 FL=1|jgi:hypothetical protein